MDAGTLVATVTKKHRGTVPSAAANFELNLGDGNFLSLNDTNSIQGLNGDLKTSALSQLKALQSQMEGLVAQLEN